MFFKSKYGYVSNVADTVKYLDETGAVAGTGAQSASLPAAGSGSYYGSFVGGLNGVAGFDSLGNVSSTGGQAISTAYSFYDAISATDSQGYSLDAKANYTTNMLRAAHLWHSEISPAMHKLLVNGLRSYVATLKKAS